MRPLIHHIVLTVSNVKKSAEFYKKVLDWKIKQQEKEYVSLAPEGGRPFLWIGLARDYKLPKNKFDRNRVGLDHFAFWAVSMAELKKIERRLRRLKIELEDGGITDDGFGETGIFCYDPDGMKVEFHLAQRR